MKERLTGAIILVVLIVLLVPELLSGPKGPAVATPPAAGAASPSSEEPPLRSYTINLGDDSHSQAQAPQPTQEVAQAAAPEKDLSESSTWDSSAATDAQAANPNSEPPATNPAPSSASTSGRDQPPTAVPPNSAATSAKPAKPPASAAVTPPPKPSPETATRAEPPKANQTTRTASAEKAVPKPHQAASAASESGGWGVQLGVFASKENADRLALDVRTKGFKASVSPVTSGKRKLYRVRVGPAADKSAAQDLQSKLKAAGRPGGTVVPYS